MQAFQGCHVLIEVKAVDQRAHLGDEIGMLGVVGADFVKLDQSIVGAAASEPNARAVLLAMATFAHQTGAMVIAEGVEDEETLEFLREVEAPETGPGGIIQGGQGFKLGYPSPEMPSSHLGAPGASAIADTVDWP